VYETEVLVYDPRVEQLLELERLDDFAPMQLGGAERQTQASAKRLAADAAGTALVYRALECRRLALTPATARAGTTYSALRRAVPVAVEKAVAKVARGRATTAFSSLGELARALGCVPALKPRAAWAAVHTFVDAFDVTTADGGSSLAEERAALQCSGAATPSSLERLSAEELARVATYVENVLAFFEDDASSSTDGDDEQPPPPQAGADDNECRFDERLEPIIAARFIDAAPLSVVGTRRRLVSGAAASRRWTALGGRVAAALDALVGAARASRSTYGELRGIAALHASWRAM
jgi:hypothetical protein